MPTDLSGKRCWCFLGPASIFERGRLSIYKPLIHGDEIRKHPELNFAAFNCSQMDRSYSHLNYMAAEVQGKRAITPEMKDSAIQTEIVTFRDDRAYETLLVRKIDGRLLPILGALYAISLIDRVNVCLLTSL
jgi:hypothetical protein